MSQAKVLDKHRRFAGKRVLTVASAQVNLFKDTDLLQLCRTPPLIRYFPFFTSHLWFLGRSASSCTQLPPRLLFLAPHPKVLQPVCGPLKRRGTSKGFFFSFFFAGFCRHEYLWTLLVFRSASGVVAAAAAAVAVVVVEPLWLFVCKSRREGEGPPRFFSSRNSPKVKA